MARELTFQLKRKKYTVSPVKIDRRKLYGWTEILAVDEQDRPCKLVTTDDTGMLLIPKGGTAQAILSHEGDWVDRANLKTVTEEGKPAELIPSSFSTMIKLGKKITEEEFLDYSITDFYQLMDLSADLKTAVGSDLYLFDYSYLDSYEATPAIVMEAGDALFMLLGYKNKFNMLCVGDCEDVDEDDDYMDTDEDDDLDFSMF